MQDVLVIRPLADSEYALTVRDEITNKLQQSEKLKDIMNTANVNDKDESLELIRAAEEFNTLSRDIFSLRRSLYIYGYKDDTCVLKTSYMLHLPDDTYTDNFAQILAINTKSSEYIQFNPHQQYYYQLYDDNIINEHIIEIFERGFGEISKFIILKVQAGKFEIYEAFTTLGKLIYTRPLGDITDSNNPLISIQENFVK